MARRTTSHSYGSPYEDPYSRNSADSSPYGESVGSSAARSRRDAARPRSTGRGGSYVQQGAPAFSDAAYGQPASRYGHAGFDARTQADHYTGVPSGPYGAGSGALGQRPARPHAVAPRDSSSRRRSSSAGTSRPVLGYVLCCIAGLLVGALVALLVFNGKFHPPAPIASTLAEAQLDTAVGAYSYAGKTYKITARDAIEGSTSLSAVKNPDGSYDAPTADMVLSFARNEILDRLVEDNGVSVSSEEISAYALSMLGTSDMSAIAEMFGMDEAQAQGVVAQAAAVGKLRQQVTGTSGSSAPVPPDAPADGNTEVGTAAYADYIIGLLGANWDSSTNMWANTTNDFYNALQGMVFAPGSANYEAALAAYGVAYAQHLAVSGQTDAWSDYVNEYLDSGSVVIATLRS